MTVSIIGLGTAVPAHAIDQAGAAAMALAIYPPNAERSRGVTTLYRRAGVQRRSSVLFSNGGAGSTQDFYAPAANGHTRGPTTATRTARHADEAPRLAAQACRTAFANAAVAPAAITHLVTVSCTGFAAPGVDIRLIESLGLSPDVERTHVGFMGCHGAINGLRVARAFAASDPAARVLLCAVELCSLHFHYSSDEQRIVANALFADGAAAAVIGADHAAVELRATGSRLIPNSTDAMSWSIGDHGFEMTLSPRVPGLIETHLPGWLDSWLGRNGLRRRDVGSWAVHPGGPRILAAVARALDLDDRALDVSRAVLADHGNMSSPTVLFILERLRSAGAPMPCAMLAFGPGLVAEAALVS